MILEQTNSARPVIRFRIINTVVAVQALLDFINFSVRLQPMVQAKWIETFPERHAAIDCESF